MQLRADKFSAVNDVSVDLWPGYFLEVIGRNWAGQSMLLMILRRITEPATGRAARLLE